MKERRADLHPQLEIKHAPESRVGAYSDVADGVGAIGNGFLETRIDFKSTKDTRQALFLNKITGETHSLEFSPFELWFDGERLSAINGRIGEIEARGSADVASLNTRIAFDWFEAELSYVLNRGEHFIHKLVFLHSFKKRGFLERVAMFRHRIRSGYEAVRHEGGMYFPIVFIRSEKGSVFFAVNFLGCFASLDGDSLSFDYYPGRMVEEGGALRLLTVVIGGCVHEGRTYTNPYHESGAGLDAGEQQWFREYLMCGPQSTHLPHLEVAKSVGKDVEGPSLLETIDQCHWFGAKHVYLPRMSDALDACPLGAAVRSRLENERISAAVRLSRDVSTNLRWVALAPDGTPASPDYGACFACDEFRDYVVDRYVDLMDMYGFKDIEVSGSPIVPCHSPAHGHASGFGSLHGAFQGLVEVTAALRENGGHVSCSGPYGSYGAGLAQLCDSTSVIAGTHPLAVPDIHPCRLFADMGRLYFRRSHSFLLPRTMLTNSVGLDPDCCPDAPYPGAEHYPWYLYHDHEGWRYNLISALATGLRHRFYVLPQDLNEEDRAFAKRWLAWEKENMTGFRHVEEILEDPGLGRVDGYSYVSARGAFVFLFNCTYDKQDVELTLRVSHDTDYVVRELYPREYNYLGPKEGLYRRGDTVSLALDPREARVVEVVRRSPASVKRKRPEVFGAQSTNEGNQVTILGKPGQRVDVGVRVQDRFERHQLVLPGPECPTHLREWCITERRYEDGERELKNGGFEGAPLGPETPVRRNAWLWSRVDLPSQLSEHVEQSPFFLKQPCWRYPERLFFVVRFEPESAFDPIRTSSGVMGVPEAYLKALPLKCGIDLAPMNLGLRAWINGTACPVYPALAAWQGLAPNPHPIVAFFFEAGSKLAFGSENDVVLFAHNFDAHAFRGVVIEHMPSVPASYTLPKP